MCVVRLVALGFLLLVSGCNFRKDKGVSQSFDGANWYGVLSQNIIEPKCSRCHAASVVSGASDLGSYEKIMASGWVVPFRPAESALYQSLSSGRMPKGGPPLSDADIQFVQDWINAGAPRKGTESAPTEDSPIIVSATYADIALKIFKPRCQSCHGAENPSSKIDLSTHAKILERGYIKAGEPSSSVFYLVMRDHSMPPGSLPKPTATEAKAVFDWIRNGAPAE